MKIWSINFDPVYPVGGAAIVCTRDDGTAEEACALFRQNWEAQNFHSDPDPVTATLLDVQPGYVNILASGDY